MRVRRWTWPTASSPRTTTGRTRASASRRRTGSAEVYYLMNPSLGSSRPSATTSATGSTSRSAFRAGCPRTSTSRFTGRRPYFQEVDNVLKYHLFSFGASYAYNESTNTFDFYEGEPLKSVDENGERIDIEVDYPQTVYLVEGNHPEVFSANGSHGTWASEGTYIKCASDDDNTVGDLELGSLFSILPCFRDSHVLRHRHQAEGRLRARGGVAHVGEPGAHRPVRPRGRLRGHRVPVGRLRGALGQRPGAGLRARVHQRAVRPRARAGGAGKVRKVRRPRVLNLNSKPDQYTKG